jgi:L-fucose mutarotase
VLNTPLLHPEILLALASSGHGARILVADGNYPYVTESPPTARKVFLNLSPGLVGVPDVLKALVSVIPIEAAMLADPADGQTVPFHETIRRELPAGVAVSARKRFDFYAEAKAPSTALVIATGEQHRFANVLLTIGVISAPQA